MQNLKISILYYFESSDFNQKRAKSLGANVDSIQYSIDEHNANRRKNKKNDMVVVRVSLDNPNNILEEKRNGQDTEVYLNKDVVKERVLKEVESAIEQHISKHRLKNSNLNLKLQTVFEGHGFKKEPYIYSHRKEGAK